MTAQTKNLLIRTLNKFKTFSEPKKKQVVAEVEDKLKSHYEGLKYIGFGFACHYVEASKIFLRLNRTLTR